MRLAHLDKSKEHVNIQIHLFKEVTGLHCNKTKIKEDILEFFEVVLLNGSLEIE